MKNKDFKIVIFTEFSKKKGLGHYVRTKRLYDFLKKNYKTSYYINKKKSFILNYLKDNTFKTIFLFDFKDYNNHNYKIKKNFFYIYFDCTFKKESILNINPLIPSKNYFSGPKWFAYPENFFSKKIFNKRTKYKKILICQGGSDANNNITSLIGAIKNRIKDIEFELNVLVPQAYRINQIQKTKYSVKYHTNIKNMGNFLNQFDHIVTSCGLLSYEINFFGIDCTYVTSEPREIKLAKYFEKKNFGKFFKISQKKDLLNHIYYNIQKTKIKKLTIDKIRYFKHNGLDNITKLILKIKNEI